MNKSQMGGGSEAPPIFTGEPPPHSLLYIASVFMMSYLLITSSSCSCGREMKVYEG